MSKDHKWDTGQYAKCEDTSFNFLRKQINVNIYNSVVAKDYLYFYNGNGISKISLNGTDEKQVLKADSSSCTCEIYCSNGCDIFFTYHENGICELLKVEANDNDKINKIIDSKSCFFADGDLDYIDGNSNCIFQFNVDSGIKTKLIDDNVADFTLSFSRIFYITADKKLYSASINGDDKNMITDKLEGDKLQLGHVEVKYDNGNAQKWIYVYRYVNNQFNTIMVNLDTGEIQPK